MVKYINTIGKIGFLLLFLSTTIVKALSGDTIRYAVSFDNAVHHEADIEIEYDYLNEDTPLTLKMSRSSPGRYAMHMFGKNVYDVEAVDENDQSLIVDYVAADKWIVRGHDGYVKFKYTLFADYADGTYSGITEQFAHLNIPASFIWAEGHNTSPILVKFHVPEDKNWKVATQLKQTSAPYLFLSPDFQYFMDSPTVLADYRFYEYRGKAFEGQQLNMALYTNADSSEASRYANWAKKIALEQKAVFGELPQFDYGAYTFICNYGPGFHGDGMEHRNSTIITSSQPLFGNAYRLVGTVSHEFFHCWNVERLRPESLEPFDFRDINTSGALWFVEGFTSYYGPLTLYRSGIYDMNIYLANLSNTLNYVLQSPGTGKFSPVTMSKRAPFVDAASNVDETNFENTFTSYYPYGAMIALALDLSLRDRFKSITLDDYMNMLWAHYGKKEIPYTDRDLLDILIKLTEDKRFANDFFDKYVFGTKVPDYKKLLNKAGFDLKKDINDAVTIGDLKFNIVDDGLNIASRPKEHMPAYLSGLEKGDVITKVDTFDIRSKTDLDSALKNYVAGDTISIEYVRMNALHSCQLSLNNSVRWQIKPVDDPTKDQEEFRRQWLSSKRGS